MSRGLMVRQLNVTRGNKPIVQDVTLNLQPGLLVSCIGPNGAGKSTLLGALAGSFAASGKITWNGAPLTQAMIGHMPQQCRVDADLTALQVLLLGRHETLGVRIKDSDLSIAGDMLHNLGIMPLANRPMSSLSGGQQQLILLGQRLIRQPKLLLLDEATSALDMAHQMRVMQLIQAYVQASGALAIMAIHDLNLAARYSDEILLMHAGRLDAKGPFASAITSERLERVYGMKAILLPDIAGAPVIVPLHPTLSIAQG
ncbi:iron complex transport system ATP-binding protein [Agrobacterium vitis]|nr:iron complex transport system ATP-binding protein [Agrobacterium vitis]MBE1439034.1 iron complex transport system ATP-binding protein [Agrobacterium vitis]